MTDRRTLQAEGKHPAPCARHCEAKAFEIEIRGLKSALRAALEQQAEPVAWRTFDGEGGYDYRTYEDNEDYAAEWAKRNPRHVGWVDPLYTTPPQRKPLTDELYNELLFAVGRKHLNETRHQTALRYIRQAEMPSSEPAKAAHGIKETP